MLDQRLEYSADNCSLMRTLEIVGERWTLLVLREAFLGVRRFDDFQRVIGCARNVLSARLETLVEHGILRREPYREPGSRVRDEYHLTEKGRALATGVIALMQWGDRYVADPEGAPLRTVHRECGGAVRAIIACERHGEIADRDVVVRPGPGAKRLVSASS